MQGGECMTSPPLFGMPGVLAPGIVGVRNVTDNDIAAHGLPIRG